jgi:hypothetical protein
VGFVAAMQDMTRAHFRGGLDMDRFLRALVASGVAVLFVLVPAWDGSLARAQDARAKFDPAVRPEFSEPVVLASQHGVLEVTLTAHQGEVHLDTVVKPVRNFLIFAYELERGLQWADVW